MSRVNPRLVYWLAALYDVPGLTADRRDILVCLATRHLDFGTGAGYCSVATLSTVLGCHEQTVRRALETARTAGLIERTKRGHRLGNGKPIASEWQIIYPPQGVTRDPLRSASTVHGSTVEAGVSTVHGGDLNRARGQSQPCSGIPPTGSEASTGSEAGVSAVDQPDRRRKQARSKTPGSARDRRRRPAIGDDFQDHVTDEIAADLAADGAEERTIDGMIANGSHPRAVRNTIAKGRKIPAGHRGPAMERARLADAADAARDALAEATGKQVGDAWAGQVARDLLARAPGHVRDPAAYVAGTIRRNPRGFLPTPTPPPAAEVLDDHARLAAELAERDAQHRQRSHDGATIPAPDPDPEPPF